MKKPWSISTTLRNPERLIRFLEIAKLLENESWNTETQSRFQVFLIMKRYYGFGSNQFTNNLSEKHRSVFCDVEHEISESEARDILNDHDYVDPDMRGRQSITPLKRFGFVKIIDNKITVSDTGNALLNNPDSFGEILLKCFLKWQCPNPVEARSFTSKMGFDIKPFVATIKFISEVNKAWTDLGYARKGISKYEFNLFIPLLINQKLLEVYVQDLIDLRVGLKNKSFEEQNRIKETFRHRFIKSFLDSDDESKISKLKDNLRDYGDNTLRYIRLTKLFRIRGGSFYIDLEEERSVEIENIINSFSSSAQEYEDIQKYIYFLSDLTLPVLPWEEENSLKNIYTKSLDSVRDLEEKLNFQTRKFENPLIYSVREYNDLIESIREYRKQLQLQLLKIESLKIESIKDCISHLKKHRYLSPMELEKYTTIGLNAINDAIVIKPNYPMGDDGEPTFTARGGIADIECYYENFKAICEVTKLRSRDQWFQEGQPVMRHLRDFEEKNEGKNYCVFIAPNIHRDTLNTFWTSIKYSFEGRKQKIIPLTITDFINILELVLSIRENNGSFSHKYLEQLWSSIISLSEKTDDSRNWLVKIPELINNWKGELQV